MPTADKKPISAYAQRVAAWHISAEQVAVTNTAQIVDAAWTEVKIDERRYAGSFRRNRERYVPN